jgi:hypothetical protein
VATAQPLAASLTLLARQLAQLYERVEEADAAPTAAVRASIDEVEAALDARLLEQKGANR